MQISRNSVLSVLFAALIVLSVLSASAPDTLADGTGVILPPDKADSATIEPDSTLVTSTADADRNLNEYLMDLIIQVITLY